MNAAAREIRTALVFGSLMILVSFLMKQARAAGAPIDRELGMRVTMVLLGGYYVVSGNRLPRLFTARDPLSDRAARQQANRRFAGWTTVLSGLAFATVWAVLPTDVATPLSVVFLVGGSIAIALRQGVDLRVIARLMGLKTIAPRELAAALGAVTVIDVNDPARFGARVPGARVLDPAAFGEADLPADRTARLVFYCSNPLCRKAGLAAKRAAKLGWKDVTVLSAGMQGWLDAGLPVER